MLKCYRFKGFAKRPLNENAASFAGVEKPGAFKKNKSAVLRYTVFIWSCAHTVSLG